MRTLDSALESLVAAAFSSLPDVDPENPALGALAELLKRYRLTCLGFRTSVVDEDIMRFYGPDIHAIDIADDDAGEILGRLDTLIENVTEPTWSVVGLLVASDHPAALPLILRLLGHLSDPMTPQQELMAQSLVAALVPFAGEPGVASALGSLKDAPGLLGETARRMLSKQT